MITHYLPFDIDGGVSPVVTWDGGPIGHLEVTIVGRQCDDAGPGCDVVLEMDRDLNAAIQNPISSPYRLGDAPPGVIEYDPGSNSWDAGVRRQISLTHGQAYSFDLARFNKDGSGITDTGDQQYTP